MATFQKRSGKWRVQVRRKGVSKSQTFYTKAEAREWATQVEREIDTGKQARRTTATLGDAFTKYSREVSPTKRGRRWEQVRLKRFEGDALADIRLSNLTAHDLVKWRDRRAQEVAAGTVNRELSLIRSVLSHARRIWEWLEDDPAKDVTRLQAPPHRDRRISDDEITRLCWALGFDSRLVKNHSHQVAVAFLLAIETGMRLGEICSIRKQDIRGRYVRLHRTKNADRRDVPLSREAMRLLSLLDGDKLFTVSAQSASVLFRRARIRAGIEDLTFHDSRHEACTRLARKIDVLDLARMLGHRNLSSLRVYYNATPDEIAARLDAADAPTAPPRQETTAAHSPDARTEESRDGR